MNPARETSAEPLHEAAWRFCAQVANLELMTDKLAELRSQIDTLDGELMVLLARREKLVADVLAFKKATHLPARIPDRIAEVINNATVRAETLGANPDLARTVWSSMVEWFVQHEERELAKR